MTHSPIDIQVDISAQTLTILWDDEHRCQYPLSGLRQVCPCVECRGGHQNMGGSLDPQVLYAPPAATVGVTKLETVGNYALQIFWNDGHQGGIYSWNLLREACAE